MNPVSMTVGILSDAFDGVRVSTEVPTNRPERLVVVTLEGATGDEFLMVASVGITCWGRDDRDAFGMANHAWESLRDASLDHPWLSATELDSIARDEWTSTGQARYYTRAVLYINTDETD